MAEALATVSVIFIGLVVHHSGFDVLIPSHSRMGSFRMQENLDASGNAGLAANETVPFEGGDHLVNRRRAVTEMALDVGFRGLVVMFGGGRHAPANSNGRRLLAAVPAVATLRLSEPSGSAFPPSAGPSVDSWKAIWNGH